LACIFGDKANVVLLLEKGAKTNVQDEEGQTPLHLACNYRHLDVIKLLLQKGKADVSIANKVTSLRRRSFLTKLAKQNSA
jgi:ankyrin repeat protein